MKAGDGDPGAVRTALSFCRICIAGCGTSLKIDEHDRIISVEGDRGHAITSGFVCSKGREAGQMHARDDRILHPLKRCEDGSFSPIPLEDALDEIAEKLRTIIDGCGPEAVASFAGMHGYLTASAFLMTPDWMKAIGSPSYFSALTVDNPCKVVTPGRLGAWSAGRQPWTDADVWLLLGTNPMVSMTSVASMAPATNPSLGIREAKARGMKLIVVDPRRTETAQRADIFLQPRPGEDAAIAAGLLRIILTEGLEDAEFCARWAHGLDELRAAVEPYTPERVAERADIPAEDLVRTARAFGGAGKRGCAVSHTGVTMSAHANLTDHLIECLNVVCGRFRRAGEVIENGLPIAPRTPKRAEVIAPTRSWERGYKARTRQLGLITTPDTGGELPSCILADEILTPGDGQIRALLVCGGNPATAIPDQRKVVRAFRSLDLLVAVDPFMTATSRLAHYVLPPKLMYERSDMPAPFGRGARFPLSFTQHTDAVVSPPAGSEVVDDWYVFWALAKRLGVQIEYRGVPLDMERPPTTDDLLALAMRDGQVSFEEVRREPRGKVFDLPPVVVEPPRPDAAARFDVMPADVREELRDYGSRPTDTGGFTHQLTVRRMRHVMNSLSPQGAEASRRPRHNPAFLHPDDLAHLALDEGALVEIVSDNDRIAAVVSADDRLRRGVVSMAHGFGGLPDEESDDAAGACTGMLISTDRDFESITAMPRMTAIPVNVVPVG